MPRRATKKTIKKAFFSILAISVVILLLVFAIFFFKTFAPLIRVRADSQNQIIRPVGNLVSKKDLTDLLLDKNIIMESLVEGSSSGALIGIIKDGPKVYFSKSRDLKWQIISLELLLKKFTIDNKKPVLIDLRFEQPIVKF